MLPADGITFQNTTITSRMIEDAASQLTSGGIRLFLAEHASSDAGGYDGVNQRIVLRQVASGSSTTTALLKAMLTHEAVHAAHHIRGKRMNSITDEGLAHAVEAVILHRLNIQLTSVYQAALSVAAGAAGLENHESKLKSELQKLGYASKARPYDTRAFIRK
jgi:hypothetical protein